MKDVTVPKAELRTVVQKNRDAHLGIFEEAVDGYREQVLVSLQNHINEVRQGRVKHVLINFPYPEDHTRDYDRVLTMLDMSIEDEIVLDETDFAMYVMDDWGWKRQFLVANAAYSTTARSQL